MLSLPKGKDLQSTPSLGPSYQSSLIILNHIPLPCSTSQFPL